jgi:16S rRNA (guanine(966)-N(2))-methyltransferase RsmD
MRIISGKYKSRRFEVPRSFKSHPTTDFAKENLFNILTNQLDWDEVSALDLFAGTGNISFELLSRGCKEVVCVEKDPVHYAFIKKTQADLQDKNLLPVRGDVFKYIQSCPKTFDLIFADPPYALPELSKIPELVLSQSLLNPDGIFIMEHPKEYDFSALPLFTQKRVYGAVNFSIFCLQ